MSSHSSSKGSELGEPATPTMAESAPIGGQDPTNPRPTHASGLRERVLPPPSEPPPRADSGEGSIRRFAAPDGDEWRAAIEPAKRRLAQSSPPTPATPFDRPCLA